jgi:predicted DNA-binding antitoxin AbrB/MazE fold protein
MMEAIRATWTNGKIVPAEPVDWPEGSQLRVEPIVQNGAEVVPGEEHLRDDPESIAEWIKAVQAIEPLIWKEGEEDEYQRYREECRRVNIEALRKRMQQTPEGESK